MPSYESSIRNLLKAVSSPNWRRPRPWRSKEEAELVKRFVFQWFTCRDSPPRLVAGAKSYPQKDPRCRRCLSQEFQSELS